MCIRDSYYQDEAGIVVCQFIPTILKTSHNGSTLTIQQQLGASSSGSSANNASIAGDNHRPDRWIITLNVNCETPSEFTLKLRLPWWVSGQPTVTINGKDLAVQQGPSAFLSITQVWAHDTVVLELPKRLIVSVLPDAPGVCAFMDGPVVLAGLCNEERMLIGDKEDPSTILTADNEREWGTWLSGYRVRNQTQGLRFKPLHEIVDERYTVYFPIRALN